MLILSRKQNEEILIGDTIRVQVVSIRGNAVRLGIKAPKDLEINRPEYVDRNRSESTPIVEGDV